jgi:hypothetical protein
MDEPIPSDNLGHRMLLKMGWKGLGSGLGRGGRGIYDPIPLTNKDMMDIGSRVGVGRIQEVSGLIQAGLVWKLLKNSMMVMMMMILIIMMMMIMMICTRKLRQEDPAGKFVRVSFCIQAFARVLELLLMGCLMMVTTDACGRRTSSTRSRQRRGFWRANCRQTRARSVGRLARKRLSATRGSGMRFLRL